MNGWLILALATLAWCALDAVIVVALNRATRPRELERSFGCDRAREAPAPSASRASSSPDGSTR